MRAQAEEINPPSDTGKVVHMSERRRSGPQLEDGYIRIANELEDALLAKIQTFRHSQVVRAIIRKTYGYGKKEDDITISQIAEMTNLHRNHVGKAVKELEEMRILNRVKAGTHGLILGINKHHEQWSVGEKKPRGVATKIVACATKLVDVESNQISCVKQPKQLQDATKLVENSNQNVAHKRQPQKTTPKDNSKRYGHQGGRTKESGNVSFDAFWSAYPNKQKKHAALKAFERLAIDAEALSAIIARIELLKQSDEWLKNAGEFIPHAATWLNGRRWEDQPPTIGYAPDELAVIDAYNSEVQGTDWPEAARAPYSRERAGLIRSFLSFSKGLQAVSRYFAHVVENVQAADTTGFDWLMRRETYLRIKEGVHRQRSEA